MDKVNPEKGFDYDVINDMIAAIRENSNCFETLILLKRWYDGHNCNTSFDESSNTLCVLDYLTGCTLCFIYFYDTGYQVSARYMGYDSVQSIDIYSGNSYLDMIMLYQRAKALAARVLWEKRRRVED